MGLEAFADFNLFELIVNIIALPILLIQAMVYGVGDIIVFDVLQLGPYLPIPSPF